MTHADCPHGGDVKNDCADCAYSGEYHFKDGECVLREELEDNYHEKFDKVHQKSFTGRIFNAVEFLHHLTNINFHFEVGELSKLSYAQIDRIKLKFSFYNYGALIKGLDLESPTYSDDFLRFVEKHKGGR
jgi:hypothetical protein